MDGTESEARAASARKVVVVVAREVQAQENAFWTPPGPDAISPPMRRGPVFWAIIAAFIIWAVAYIRATSYRIGGDLYFSLFDDAMISMRYARNLASGHGLVWNPGEPPIEGITNLLWTLWMALLHLLPLEPRFMSLPVQVTGAALLVANLFVVHSLAGWFEARGWGRFGHQRAADTGLSFADLAVLLTAFYYPLNKWTLLGLEVGLLTLLFSAGVLLLCRALERGQTPWTACALFGMATLVRIDAAGPCGAAWLAALLVAPPLARKRFAIAGLAAFVTGLGAQTLFRIAYFGDPLPNTYYLKMEGFPALSRMGHGLGAMHEFLWPEHYLLAAAAFAGWAFGRMRAMVLPPVVWLVCAAYSVYVGGDAWEMWGGANRFVAPAMPLMFVMLAGGVGMAWRALPPAISPARSAARNAALAMLAVGALVASNAYNGRRSLEDIALLWRPVHTDGNPDVTHLALDIERRTLPDARIALTWVGVPGYFLDRPVIDLLGKCDPVIARQPMRIDPARSLAEQFYPGHMKWDYAHSVGTLKPDIVALYWPATKEELDRHFRPHYTLRRAGGMRIWIRKDSTMLKIGQGVEVLLRSGAAPDEAGISSPN